MILLIFGLVALIVSTLYWSPWARARPTGRRPYATTPNGQRPLTRLDPHTRIFAPGQGALWALILGFGRSAVVQVVVSKREMRRRVSAVVVRS